ncbi:MAG: Hint domain-containing protein [Polyangiaceae bacterium]|nr:Hint domain-containing protein [Polyangiaceae bacterium]
MLVKWSGVALVGAALAVAACSTCFVRGTRVLTPKGMKAIEEIEVGDEVLSFDLTGKKTVVRKVGKVLRSKAKETFAIEAEDHLIAGVTAEHPFFDLTLGDYVKVENLTMKARFLATMVGGERRAVAASKISRTLHLNEVEVFNLTIAGEEQNYFAEGILVHNKGALPPDKDGDNYLDEFDCDDDDADVNPGVSEDCGDGIDNDCDEAVDADDQDCGGTSGNVGGATNSS